MTQVDRNNESRSRRDLKLRVEQLEEALAKAQESQAEVRAVLDCMSAPPWHVGRLLRLVETALGTRALVWIGDGMRALELHPKYRTIPLLPDAASGRGLDFVGSTLGLAGFQKFHRYSSRNSSLLLAATGCGQ